MATDADLVLNSQSRLGEGAVWNADSQRLYWVDIEGKLFHVYNPESGLDRAYPTYRMPGTVVPAGKDKVLLALDDGIAELNLHSGEITYKLNTNIHIQGKRFNDGKCDAKGRFWVGSMALDTAFKAGALYCIDKGFEITEKITGVTISNGIVWTADQQTMYYIDTPTGEVAKYDYDLHTGTIKNKKVVISIPSAMGYPDGMTIDVEGKLWIALWDGFCVARYDPVNGELLQKVELPVPKITSCAFGGPRLDQLYITTARVEMNQSELSNFPLSGGLFRADVGTTGLASYHFKE